jgi:uncharacterized membrane protein
MATTAPATTSPISAALPSAEPARARLASIDIVRGAIMVLMALDHVRDFVTELRFPPENLAQGSAALFATRWFTHFCAPGFFLLAGLGIGLALNRRRSRAEMTRYLLTRGVWLLILELVITPVGWRFSLDLFPAFALVLWALGWSMIVMAVLVHLPRAALATIAIAMIAGHNLLDGVSPAAFGSFDWLWNVIHVPGFVIPGKLLIAYPLMPWIGVMALGYVLAGTYAWDAERRRRLFLSVGAVAVALFIALRFANGYGNPDPWTPQRTSGLTVASFLNVRKYPPSLHFLLMTLGPVLIALALTERVRGRVGRWLAVYGRVPLFFYVTHIFVAHLAGMLVALAQGGELRRIPIFTDPASLPDWFGVGLPRVYLAWALVVVALYFPCRAFARMKDRRRDWWLQYL